MPESREPSSAAASHPERCGRATAALRNQPPGDRLSRLGVLMCLLTVLVGAQGTALAIWGLLHRQTVWHHLQIHVGLVTGVLGVGAMLVLLLHWRAGRTLSGSASPISPSCDLPTACDPDGGADAPASLPEAVADRSEPTASAASELIQTAPEESLFEPQTLAQPEASVAPAPQEESPVAPAGAAPPSPNGRFSQAKQDDSIDLRTLRQQDAARLSRLRLKAAHRAQRIHGARQLSAAEYIACWLTVLSGGAALLWIVRFFLVPFTILDTRSVVFAPFLAFLGLLCASRLLSYHAACRRVRPPVDVSAESADANDPCSDTDPLA